MILDITYPISQRDSGDLVLHNIEIGAICVAGNDIFVSWYDHNTRTYGVDKVDYDNKLDGAYIETKLIPVYRTAYANYTAFVVAYASIPTGTSIEVWYSIDYGTSYTQTSVVDDTDRWIFRTDVSIEATQIMVKIISRTVDNDGPVYESAGVMIS